MSQYKGVSEIVYQRRESDWKAQLSVAGKLRYLGKYDTEEQAAYAVDNARLYLARFFKEPLDTSRLNLESTRQEGPSPTTQKLEQELIDQNAIVYTHGLYETGRELSIRVIEELLDEAKRRVAQLSVTLDRLRQPEAWMTTQNSPLE